MRKKATSVFLSFYIFAYSGLVFSQTSFENKTVVCAFSGGGERISLMMDALMEIGASCTRDDGKLEYKSGGVREYLEAGWYIDSIDHQIVNDGQASNGTMIRKISAFVILKR